MLCCNVLLLIPLVAPVFPLDVAMPLICACAANDAANTLGLIPLKFVLLLLLILFVLFRLLWLELILLLLFAAALLAAACAMAAAFSCCCKTGGLCK